ncbi:MAG: hypothetical protein RJB66_21 [Pseudomonadota bacterium]|jgi:soluble cytochrome b562
MQQQEGKDDLRAQLDEWDALIKEGKTELVKKQVKSILTKIRLQREQRLGFAKILRLHPAGAYSTNH